MAETINLGKVLVSLEGEHDSTRSYDKYCEVNSGGNSYVSKKAVPIGTPITDTTYWQKRASKGVDGNDGADAYQPFKGWYADTTELNSSFGTPQVGDYAYVKGASASYPVAIYQCATAGTWTDSGRTFNPSNNQEFASGESLNATNIVDGLTSTSPTDVLSAKQGKVLNEKVNELGLKTSQNKTNIDNLQQEIDAITPIVIEGNVTNASDEEDITTDNNLLKLKDRPTAVNQKGYKILRKGASLSSQMAQVNTIYEVRYSFDLGGSTLNLPSGCTLHFNGGSFSNGVIACNDTVLSGDVSLNSVTFSGKLAQQINLKWFGAVGDYSNTAESYTNNNAALAQCIAACASCGAEMYVPSGNYYYTAALICNGTFNIVVDGVLYYGGDPDTVALTIGEASVAHSFKKFDLNLQRVSEPSTTANSYGIYLYNLSRSNIHIRECANFVNNVTFCGSVTGFVYNKIYIDCISNGLRLLTLTTKNNGWTNENVVVGGKYTASSTSVFRGSHIGITITSECDYRSNSNLFIKPCVEGCLVGVDFVWANQNTVLGGRFEGCTTVERAKNNSVRNAVFADYLKSSGTSGNTSDFTENGLVSHYPMLFSSILGVAQTQALCYSSGELKYAKDADGYVALEGFSFVNVTNGSVSRYSSGASVDADGIIHLPASNLSLEFNIDTSTAKRFKLEIEGSVRLVFRLYDNSGNLIGSQDLLTDTNATYNSQYSWTVVDSSVSGSYRFEVFSNVYKVKLNLRKISTTDATLNSINIFASSKCSVRPTGSGIQLPSAPVASRGVRFVENSSYSAGGNIGWANIASSWVAISDITDLYTLKSEINVYCVKAYDSGVLRYAKDGSGNVALEGFSFYNINNYHVARYNSNASIDSNGDFYLPSGSGENALLIDIDTSIAKRFKLLIDGQVKPSFRLYDSNGTIIESADLTGSSSVSYDSTYQWTVPAANISGYWNFRVNDNVKSVQMFLRRASSSGLLKRVTLYADKECAISQRGSGIRLPAIPVASSDVYIVNNSAYAAGAVPAWIYSNGTWLALPVV